MFLQIFLFEIKYRLRRPGIWLCFFGVFLFSFFSFALGNVPNFDRYSSMRHPYSLFL